MFQNRFKYPVDQNNIRNKSGSNQLITKGVVKENSI